MSLKFRPMGDFVVLQRIKVEQINSIIVPSEVVSGEVEGKDKMIPLWRVMAVGIGHLGPGGIWVRPDVRVGDVVIHSVGRSPLYAVPQRDRRAEDDIRMTEAHGIVAVIEDYDLPVADDQPAE